MNQTIRDFYNSLCISFRLLSLEKRNKEGKCRNCKELEYNHYNNRCGNSLTDLPFVWENQDLFSKVESSLMLVEQLMKVQGWESNS